MRKLILIAAAGVLLSVAGNSAQASLVRVFPKHQTVSQRKTIIKVNLKHTRYVCHASKIWKVKLAHCRASKWLRSELEKLRPRPIVYSTYQGLPPHYSAWLCIHKYEGSWTDSGDPYWGGLQMDRNFMETFASRSLLSRGWANSWTPLEQMWVAEKAYNESGFHRWPNTARYCGLL
jgi:hypothetical protein